MRGLDAERERAEPRSLAASRASATALSVLWLPVFLSPRRHEEGDSSLGSSSLLKRLASYQGRKGKEGPLASAPWSPGRPHRLWARALPSPADTTLPLRLPWSEPERASDSQHTCPNGAAPTNQTRSCLRSSDTQDKGASLSQKGVLTRNRICWHLDLGLPASRTEKYITMVERHPICVFC